MQIVIGIKFTGTQKNAQNQYYDQTILKIVKKFEGSKFKKHIGLDVEEVIIDNLEKEKVKLDGVKCIEELIGCNVAFEYQMDQLRAIKVLNKTDNINDIINSNSIKTVHLKGGATYKLDF